jgi:hypothetical protein
MRSHFVMILVLLLLEACAGVQNSEINTYDKTYHARIRAIKGAAIRFYPNQECSSPTLLHIGERSYSATGGVFAALESNKTIGMPKLKNTPRYFNEHIVAANESLTIEALVSQVSQQTGRIIYSCGPVVGTFSPSPGADYEVSIVYIDGGCNLSIREIYTTEVEEKSSRVAFKPSARCRG